MKNKILKLTVFLLVMIVFITLIICLAMSNNTTSESNTGSASSTEENAPMEKQMYLPYTLTYPYVNSKMTYYYNEYGNEIRVTEENLDGEILATWINEYDENQNLIKIYVDTGKGTPFVQVTQIYDDKGNLIERHELESVITFQYDGQNRVTSKKVEGKLSETYTYAEDGSYRVQSANNPDEYRTYNKDGKILERHNSATRKTIYSYNEEGVLIETASYSDGVLTQKQIYQLDEHGNPIKVIHISSSGEETVLGEYEYKLYTIKEK